MQPGNHRDTISAETRMDILYAHRVSVVFLIGLFVTGCLARAVTPTVSGPIGDPEKAGQKLAQKLIVIAPPENSSASGVLKIHDKDGHTREVPVSCQVSVSSTGADGGKNWQVTYIARQGPGGEGQDQGTEKLTIVHTPNQPNEYFYTKHAASKPQVLGLLLVLAGAAIRLRGNADVGMLILTGIFTVITAPVVANRVGQLAYREQNLHDTLTTDELDDYTRGGTNGQN